MRLPDYPLPELLPLGFSHSPAALSSRVFFLSPCIILSLISFFHLVYLFFCFFCFVFRPLLSNDSNFVFMLYFFRHTDLFFSISFMCLFMFGASISHNDSYDFKNSLYIESVGETLWNLLGQMKSLFLSTFCWTQQIKPLGSRWIITHHLAVFIFPLLSLSASFSVCLRFCLFTSLFVCFAYMYVVFASICILCLCRTVLLCVGLSIFLRFDLSLSFCQSIHPVIHESTYFNIYWSITECFFFQDFHTVGSKHQFPPRKEIFPFLKLP